MRKFISILVCLLSLIPIILIPVGVIHLTHNSSSDAVIIGPIVLPNDDMLNGGVSSGVSSDNSSANLSRDTPYSNGALRSYKTLGVYNNIRDSGSWNGFKYARFCRYFVLVRDDGRPIYDDDGILDTGSSRTDLADEVINYYSHFYSVETTLPNKPDGGFMWTNQQAKFKSTKYNFSMENWSSTIECLATSISTNPSNSTRTLKTLVDKNGNVVTSGAVSVSIWLTGTGQYENTFWGNTGGDTSINSNMTGYIKLANRDWSNELKASNVGVGTYNGKTAYYSPKNYTVVARNLNNYVKVDSVQATPQYGSSVVPFADGHHISISGEGYTYVEIENGAEGVYTPYYCFVDTKLPTVSFTYSNSNATSNAKTGSVSTNSKGARSQTNSGYVFKDEVKVEFSADLSSESPETATYTYNGVTKPLTSGTWFKNEGDYIVTITDLAGNTTTYKFTIDKTDPNYNLSRLQSDTTYKISKWYLATIPSGYNGAGTYSFATYEDALSYSKQMEFKNKVTTYNLTNINSFTDTHLIAKGDKVKVGDYYYYKSVDNPNLYVYYFNEDLLWEAIEKYAKGFVSEPQTYRYNTTVYTNNYGTKCFDGVVDNIIQVSGVNAYLATNFTFRHLNNNDTYKIYYDYQEDTSNVWKEFSYGTPFKQQVSGHGLYKIKEIDFVGHETYYYIFLDLQAPTLDVEAKIYGKDSVIKQTISVNDIPVNGELHFYYESFKIAKINENDKWYVIEVKCPDNTTKRYTYLDGLPNFEELGSGEYSITLVDRSNNKFTFKVSLLGKAPEVKFEIQNANTQMKVTIINGDEVNVLTDLKIFRNGVCLNSEEGYDEQPNNDENELIFISTSTLSYIFKKGGMYSVELTDNFGRVLTYEYKFEKDLPTGILVGVEHNGKTNSNVQFIFDNNKYFAVANKDNALYEPEITTDSSGKLDTMNFYPEENSFVTYKIYLYDKEDTENYNLYTFAIKTIKPIINLYGVSPNGVTGGDVFALWEVTDEQYTATYSLNGTTQEYKKGQILSAGGTYSITLSDELGNTNTVNFSIDKTISFTIIDNYENKYSIEEIRYINFDINIIEDEPLTITITKNDEEIDYEFGHVLSEEGNYTVRIYDEFNNSEYFYFTIDKTPPVAELHNVENFGITNQNVWVSSDESNLTCWCIRNGEYYGEYQLSTDLTESGKYIVYVSDLAKNYISFEFEIDNVVSYNINTYYGGISNGDVKVVAYENLIISMMKDGKFIEYEFEQILNEEGEYSFTLQDDLGNKESFFFSIINKKKQNLNHLLQVDIEVKSVTKNDEPYEFTITKGYLYIYDEGDYVVTILDHSKNEEFTFNITIDTTPPTLVLVNVENGGSTKKIVSTKDLSETPCDLITYCDGLRFDYKYGDEIEKCGRFKMTVVDEAGNKTEYTFERIYSLNGASIALIGGLLAIAVVLIAIWWKSRHRYYVHEEEIEETVDEVVYDIDNSNSVPNTDDESADQ